jgi:ATP adenylyltransferase
VSFDNLWAGWRAAYVGSVSTQDLAVAGAIPEAGEDVSACVFCRILASGESDEARLVVNETEAVAVMLNAYPYASGHLLVMPRRHAQVLEELTSAESAELWAQTMRAIAVLTRAYAPDGVNFGANLGRAAGAGIPKHLHLHVVPRWIGDTNFMSTIAAVRVLPESLPDTWQRLRSAWAT